MFVMQNLGLRASLNISIRYDADCESSVGDTLLEAVDRAAYLLAPQLSPRWTSWNLVREDGMQGKGLIDRKDMPA
jgi:hypothetical protein